MPYDSVRSHIPIILLQPHLKRQIQSPLVRLFLKLPNRLSPTPSGAALSKLSNRFSASTSPCLSQMPPRDDIRRMASVLPPRRMRLSRRGGHVWWRTTLASDQPGSHTAGLRGRIVAPGRMIELGTWRHDVGYVGLRRGER